MFKVKLNYLVVLIPHLFIGQEQLIALKSKIISIFKHICEFYSSLSDMQSNDFMKKQKKILELPQQVSGLLKLIKYLLDP